MHHGCPSRRDFLTSGLLIAGGLAMPGLTALGAEVPALTIDRIDIWPVRYPTVMRFKFFEGPDSAGGRPAVIIRITASDGTVGWGESVPIPRWSDETLEGAVAAIEHYLKPILIGMNPFDLEGIHAAMNREIANGFSTGAPITKAGIDIALHDLIGKATGRNVAELWGRKAQGSLTLSWTLNPSSLEEVDALIERGRDRGFENFNVKVAPDIDTDLALCRMVKERVPDGFLWADANGGYSPEAALKAAPLLAEAGVPVLEQPVRPNRIATLQALKQQGALPIILDEGVVSPVDLEQYIALGCCDGMAMKPARCGGLVSAVAQLELLERHNLLFLGSGLTDPDISLAASLILYSAFGLSFPAALNGPQFLGFSVLDAPFVPEGGSVTVPTGPGLGISVNEDKVKELAAMSRA